MTIRCVGFRRHVKNTLLGFADLELVATGIVIRGCPWHRKNDREWVGFPAQPYKAKDGSISWTPVVEFSSGAGRSRDEFPAARRRGNPSGRRRVVTVPTPSSVRATARRLDRRNARTARAAKVVAAMAGGLSLHRFSHTQWALSNGEAIDAAIAREVIKHHDIIGAGDTLFHEFRELSQSFHHVGKA
jgi:hypothetical protein